MTPLLLVAERELTVRVRSASYRLATLMGPLLIGAMTFLPVLLLGLDRPDVQRVAIVDETGEVAAVLAAGLEKTGRYVVAPLPRGGESGARQALRAGSLDGYLVVPGEVWSGAPPTFYGRGPAAARGLEPLLSAELARLRMKRAGLDPARVSRLARPTAVQTYRVEEDRKPVASEDRSSLAFPLILALYFMILLYGMAIMTSVTDEKASRTVEVLFASVRPFDLMAGKLLGVGGAALLQVLVWGLAGFAAARVAPEAAGLEPLSRLGPGIWAAFALFFCAGFLLFGTLYLAMGALAGSTDDIQHLNLPITTFALLAFLLAIYAMDRPDTALATGLSLVPLFAPMLLFARLIVSDVPPWQLGLGALLLAGAILVGLHVAARIYRAAMLLHGRRPRLREVAAWLSRS